MPGVMLLMSIVEQLNSHKYLYLDHLFEEVDLELCILVDEAKVQGGNSGASGDTSSYGAIVSDETCRKYRIVFKNYAAYSVRDESYADRYNEEEFTGNLFRVYSKSKFLDYVAASMIAFEDISGPYKHYGIVCLNHIINVASSHEPSIEVIGASSGDGAT
jgi:hypothetical protein